MQKLAATFDAHQTMIRKDKIAKVKRNLNSAIYFF